ncbi:YbfA family protein [Moellerella wisconsensis]|uniref:YbfA family protein n=1 Tax=Moellerella wisconsensis TaxID=158849 RepID=UPI003075F949
MTYYREYTQRQIILRRTAAIIVGVLAFPIMIFYRDRGRFYSYLHRVWAKTSDKPVWLEQSELTSEMTKRS